MGKRIEAGELVELKESRLCRVTKADGRSYPTWRGSSYPIRRLDRGTKVMVTGREMSEAWGLMIRFIRLEDGVEFLVESNWVRRVKE